MSNKANKHGRAMASVLHQAFNQKATHSHKCKLPAATRQTTLATTLVHQTTRPTAAQYRAMPGLTNTRGITVQCQQTANGWAFAQNGRNLRDTTTKKTTKVRINNA